ncbi:PadR family transcriptional regulator [Cryptosporangium sp. NPDC048952]|uniref:PadR family transcriptional regulator n=1 Tax=Cryptosporangium sp. NPDC048952 TaxID=3363961 RepID=UPI003716680E
MLAAPALSLPEWIVLTLVDEAPMHGFAIAALTAEHNDVGRAWHVPRPIVYRNLDRLTELGLVRREATEAGRRGPQRSILTTTPTGAAAVQDWLRRPAAHVRDLRSELLVKLALLLRRHLAPHELIAAQRTALLPVRAALGQQRAADDGFGLILTSWRVENVNAALRFLDSLEDSLEDSPDASATAGSRPEA